MLLETKTRYGQLEFCFGKELGFKKEFYPDLRTEEYSLMLTYL